MRGKNGGPETGKNQFIAYSFGFFMFSPHFFFSSTRFFVNQFVGREIKGFRVRRPFRLRPPFRLVSHLTVRLKMQIIGRPVMS